MAHRQPPVAQVVLDGRGESQQAKRIGDRAPVLADPLPQLLLRPSEVAEELAIALRRLDRVQVLTEEVLDEGQLQALGVGHLPDNGGKPRPTPLLSGPPPPPAPRQFVVLARPP